MCIQSIQRKKTLCKLISATFLMNSAFLPSAFAAEEVASASTGDTAATGTSASANTTTNTTASTTATTSTTATAATGTSSTKPTSFKDPSWAFKEDGTTPLTTEELKALNFKNYYSTSEVQDINTYLKYYGYDWLVSHGFNVSLNKDASGTTYIVIPQRKAQANSTTDNSSTESANSATAVTCGDGYEMLNGSCTIKCGDYAERNTKTGACDVKSCGDGKMIGSNGMCEAIVCPTGYNLEGSSCVKDAAKDTAAACTDGKELVNGFCLAKCADGKTRDTDGVCKTKSSDGVCQLKYQEWNEKDGKCEDKVCATGQTLDKTSGECKDTTTCPIGQEKNSYGTCVATDCSKSGKKTWTNGDGVKVCVDACGANQRRNEKTGVCSDASTTVVSCPSNTIKNQSNGTCDTCPSGQTPNSDQTSCVATDSGSSSSHKNKTKDTLGTLAGLAGLFLSGKKGGAIENPESSKSGINDNGYGKSDGKDGQYKVYGDTKGVEMTVFEHGETTPLEVVTPETPIDAIIKIDDPQMKKAKLTLQGASYNLASVPGQGFNYASGSKSFSPGEKFQLGPNEGLHEGQYYVYVVATYTAEPTKANQTLTDSHIERRVRIPLVVRSQVNTLSDADRKFVETGITQMEPNSSVGYFLRGNIAEAVWKDGTCQLKINDGQLVSNEENEKDAANIDKEVLVSTTGIPKGQCDNGLVHRSLSMGNVTVDSSGTGLQGDNGNVFVSEQSWNDMDESQQQMYKDNIQAVAKENNVTFFENESFPYTKNADGKWADIKGNVLDDDTQADFDEKYDVSTDEAGKSTVVSKEDGSAVSFSAEDYGKAMDEAFPAIGSTDILDKATEKFKDAVFGNLPQVAKDTLDRFGADVSATQAAWRTQKIDETANTNDGNNKADGEGVPSDGTLCEPGQPCENGSKPKEDNKQPLSALSTTMHMGMNIAERGNDAASHEAQQAAK